MMDLSPSTQAIFAFGLTIFNNILISIIGFTAVLSVTVSTLYMYQWNTPEHYVSGAEETRLDIASVVALLHTIISLLLRWPGHYWLGLTLLECNLACFVAIAAPLAAVITGLGVAGLTFIALEMLLGQTRPAKGPIGSAIQRGGPADQDRAGLFGVRHQQDGHPLLPGLADRVRTGQFNDFTGLFGDRRQQDEDCLSPVPTNRNRVGRGNVSTGLFGDRHQQDGQRLFPGPADQDRLAECYDHSTGVFSNKHLPTGPRLFAEPQNRDVHPFQQEFAPRLSESAKTASVGTGGTAL